MTMSEIDIELSTYYADKVWFTNFGLAGGEGWEFCAGTGEILHEQWAWVWSL